MKKILVGVIAIGAALAAGPASAGPGEDAQARIDALEKENAATQNVKLSASYRLDAFFGVLNQTFATSAQTTDRDIHGPRVAVTAQF